MSALESFNLGDFLRIREEDENRRRVDSLNSLAGLTLNDIILSEKRAQARVGRTLLDVIGAPEPSHDVSTRQRDRDRNSQMEKERRTWKAIKDRLRLKRNGAVLNSPDVSVHRQSNGTGSIRRPSTSGEPGPADVITGSQNSRTGLNLRPVAPISGDSGSTDGTRRVSTMRLGDHILMDPAELGRSRRLAAALSDEREAAAAEGDGEQPVRMSLMELLEESTERQVGASRYEVGADEEEEGGSEAPATAPAEQKCCVCMIRHRGAAFIPCGHTFCRACSRELFLHRGNCPLCNAQISEILDIF